MNILHVLSQVVPTGAEFYACSLADQHLKQGHTVVIVSDTLTAPTKATYLSAQIAKRDHLQRVKNIFFLRKVISENNINIVHAHSRAASWVSYFATIGTGAALVSTVHGRQHLHTSTSLYDIYGDKVIAICKNVAEHLQSEVKIKRRKISVIPNGIDFQELSTLQKPEKSGKLIVSIFGRTNGPKGAITARLINDVIPKMLQQCAEVYFQIGGGKAEHLGNTTMEKIKELEHKFGERFKVLGFINNLPLQLNQSSLVICSGRVAMESLYLQVPVFAFGEASYHGLVTTENFEEVLHSNFGDISETQHQPGADFQKVENDLKAFIVGKIQTDSALLREKIENCFALTKVAGAVMEVYRSARMRKIHPRPFPVLMYHKIVDEEPSSSHKIFILKEKFERHLRFLKKNNFTPITFKEYLKYSMEQLPAQAFPMRPVILTFDDGYKDNFVNALPLMKKYGFPGVIFLLGRFDITYNYWDADKGEHKDALMKAEEKMEFVRSGWEIGAHSMTHPDLTTCQDDVLMYELQESKKELERVLNTQVISFAYPTGIVNERVKNFSRDTGYTYGVATDTGGIHLEDDHFQVFRVNVFPQDVESQLRKKTSWWYRYYYRWKRKK